MTDKCEKCERLKAKVSELRAENHQLKKDCEDSRKALVQAIRDLPHYICDFPDLGKRGPAVKWSSLNTLLSGANP